MLVYAIYILLLVYLIIRYDFHGGKNGKQWDFFFRVLFFFTVLIPTLSYNIGLDTLRYEQWYNEDVKPIYRFSFDDFRYEPIFCLVISLFKTIGLSWFVVRALIVGFINFAIFSFGKRYVKHFFTFILLYFLLHFYEMNYEPIRQSVAMSIFLLAIPYIEKKEKVMYLFWIAIATGFHISAVFAFVLPFLKWLRFNLLGYVFLLFILIVGSYINVHFSEVIALTSLIGGEEYYELYLKSDLVNNQLNVNGMIALLVVKVIPIIVSVKLLKTNKITSFPHMEAAAFVLVTFMVLSAAIPLLDRFVLFWGIIQVSLLSDAMYAARSPRKSPVIYQLIGIYIGFSFILNVYMYYNNANQYGFKNYRRFYPYGSVLNKHEDKERQNYYLIY